MDPIFLGGVPKAADIIIASGKEQGSGWVGNDGANCGVVDEFAGSIFSGIRVPDPHGVVTRAGIEQGFRGRKRQTGNLAVMEYLIL